MSRRRYSTAPEKAKENSIIIKIFRNIYIWSDCGRFFFRKDLTVKILLIEDDKAISDVIKRGLEDDGLYKVVVAEDGLSGLDAAWDYDFSLIIMDIMLPGIDGLEICRKLRTHEISTPILMLTAKDSIEDIVKGFETGGSGLGLAICRTIAEAYGGWIEIKSSAGKGTEVSGFFHSV